MNTEPFRWVEMEVLSSELHALAKAAAVEISGMTDGLPWQRFRNRHEHKDAITFEQARDARCAAVWAWRQWFAADETAELLSYLFDIPGLKFDGLGGGVHRIPAPGGHLDVHVDFNQDRQGRWRRVNVLLFLNERWNDPGGELELWSVTDDDAQPVVCFTPELGTLIAFECSERSWHGHPVPLQNRTPRKSLAAYYFTDDPPVDAMPPHSTRFLT